MKRFLIICASIAAFVGCNHTEVLLPNISGKAGEIIVVIDKDNWEGALGKETRDLLAGEVPFLPQSEPMFSLVNVPPGGFGKLFKVHRNVIQFKISSQIDSAGVMFARDVWAEPQSVVQISAYDADEAIELLRKKGSVIARYIEQAEIDRNISNTIKYEEKALAERVLKSFGGDLHFPVGYKLRKASDDFIWIAYDRQYVYQDVFVYKYPAEEDHPFTSDNIIRHRNEVLKANVPGMFDGTYMTTSEYFTPLVEYFKYKGRNIVQTRGLWDVTNDYMGGPFVSHSFYSPDGKDIIVLEAFVYAPRYDKRQYLRQVESLLYSWEWSE